MATTGYCVRCKAKQEMKGEKMVEMKGKGGMVRNAVTGECPVCATKMFRILGKADAAAIAAKEGITPAAPAAAA